MSGKSPIQWTEQTWNPVTGCTRVSPGCDHCFAFQLHDQRHIAWKRGRWPDAPMQYHTPFSQVQLLPERLGDPLKWRKPRRVFVNSMSDLFHPNVPDEFIEAVFGVMASTPQHTYQILTKRPERMRQWVSSHTHEECVAQMIASGVDRGFTERQHRAYIERVAGGWPWPLPNVWLGVSVENQEAADERIPMLLQTPAAVRFLSCEPLLGPISRLYRRPGYLYTADIRPSDDAFGRGIDWVIIGGESGPHARIMQTDWASDLMVQCDAAGVSVFVKQLGSWLARECGYRDKHGGDPSEWPEYFRIREFPTSVREAVMA